MKHLTGEQRYWQAVTKADIIVRRDIRLALEGKRQWIPARDERKALIAEIDRAYEAGFRDGRAST